MRFQKTAKNDLQFQKKEKKDKEKMIEKEKKEHNGGGICAQNQLNIKELHFQNIKISFLGK